MIDKNLRLCDKCAERLNLKEFENVKSSECIFCSGIFDRLEIVSNKILNEIKDYELRTFQVGTTLKGSIKSIEEFFFEILGYLSLDSGLGENLDESDLHRMSIKNQINSFLSKKLVDFGLSFNKVSDNQPDLVVIINAETLDYKISISPLYIYGRYVKRVRNIPQTRWLCSECKGRGCQVCGFTGKRYPISVEELIIQPSIEMAKAESAVIHGAGREDIDARMLGNGRPFILEIRKPKIRKLNLKELEKEINKKSKGKIKVKFEKFVCSRDVAKLKTSKFKKKYRAVVEFYKEVSEDELKKALEELSYRVINQFTPTRVEHRRAKMLRKRKTYTLELLLHNGKKAVITVEADSGLYIKELVSGDGGRTKPSLSEVLNNPSKVVKLDVIEVKGGL